MIGCYVENNLLFVPKQVKTSQISRHYNNQLANYFRIEKTEELIAQKYYWSIFCCKMKAYIISCDVWLTLKAIKLKSYINL